MRLFVCALALAPLGCVTLLTDAEIRNLTTCHGTDWSRISKSLVKAGYSTAEGDEELRAEGKDGTLIHVRRLDADSFTFEARRDGKPVVYQESTRGDLWKLQHDVCG